MDAQNSRTEPPSLALAPANDSAPPHRVRPAPVTPDTTRLIQQRLGRAIRNRRRLLDMTLENLAQHCGVTFQQVHKYESGVCSMSAAQLWSISVALDVPVAYFYEALTASDLWRAAEDPRFDKA